MHPSETSHLKGDEALGNNETIGKFPFTRLDKIGLFPGPFCWFGTNLCHVVAALAKSKVTFMISVIDGIAATTDRVTCTDLAVQLNVKGRPW